MKPWVEKYRPKKVDEVVGNEGAKRAFLEWIRSWESGKPSKRAAFLYGPAGVGKTSLAIAYSLEHGYELVEVNASDWRRAKDIESVVGMASQQATVWGHRSRMVLVDEVDGLAGEDVGGVSAITKAVSKTMVPIILVANDPWRPDFASLREMCVMIEFKKVGKKDIVSRLEQICKYEGVEYDIEALKEIASMSTGDVRSAINDLQAVYMGRGKVTKEGLDMLGYRDRDKSLWEALGIVFNSKSLATARSSMENLQMDRDTFFTWIVDNIPNQFSDPNEMADALEWVARADVYLKRIDKTQNWGLLKYANPIMTAGVALSRKSKPGGFVKYSKPHKYDYLRSIGEERRLRMGIASKVSRKIHMSSYKANLELIPYLKLIFSNDGSSAEGLAKYFELEPKEVAYLAGKEKKVEEAKPPIKAFSKGTSRLRARKVSRKRKA